MKKSHMNIFLTAGVITLLLLSGCASGILNISQSNTTNDSLQENTGTNDNAIITTYISGVPHSQVISYESGTYLKELFSELAIANAHDPCSAETQQLQQQILLFAEEHGLLPAGMSADTVLAQLGKRSQSFAPPNVDGGSSVYPAGIGREMFCNFVSTGEGAAFPIIILPRFIPFIMAPIPRLFVGWKTPLGLTSCGGLLSGTGFYAVGPQQGFALGFWGIGFSIFLPPVMAYGMFGYALFAKASAEYMEYYPPNHPPEITAVYPLDGASYVPLSTSELQFHIGDYDSDLMSYSVTTYPDVGGGNGNMKPDGTYTIPVSGLKSSTEYSWHVTVSDGKDTVEVEFTFTTEAVAPVISDVVPVDGDRYVPITQGYLHFHLRDPQNDLMSYTVETSPFIGSGSGSGVGEGYISVPISGLDVMSEYRWFVNVTDGENPTSEVFWFRTEPLMVFDPFMEGWAYRKLITVDHTMVVGDLENFPVLLSVTDSDLRDKAQDDGDDILFMNGAGVATRVYHEIEEFDDSTGRLIAWVNVSSLSSTVDNSFYMYYGNMDSDDQQCPEKTWDSHYIMVQHMNGASYNLMKDSTCNQNDVTSKNDNPLFHSNGKIGYAVGFDGSNDRLHWSTPVRNTFPMSVEIWVESDSPNGPRYAIANGGETGASYGLFLNIENDYLRLGLKDTSNHGMGQYLVPPNPGTWYFCAGTWQGNLYNATFYVDDIIFSGTPVSIQYGGARNLQLGASTANQYYWDGVVDEIRISDIIRSEEWILTGYNNQNSPSDFLSIGPEEPHP